MQVMRYNLSVAYALRSEWEKANTLLKEVGYVNAARVLYIMCLRL